MDLPEAVARAMAPLFEALPLDQAMTRLVVTESPGAHVDLVDEMLRSEALRDAPALQSATWLYVDELDRSHTLSQGIDDSTGSYWHGIMHRREGDFSNSHYWFNKVGHHPAMATIDGYDAHQFIDDVEAGHGSSPQNLIDLQRREWQTLFEYCANG